MPDTTTISPIIGTAEADILSGGATGEVISGVAENDILSGNGGDDEVWGGSGDDTIYGNNGDDVLYGGGGPNYIAMDALDIAADYTGSVTFEGETAGYRNTLGWYKIDSETGQIGEVEILWANASLQGSGGDLVGGVSDQSIELQAGDRIGFFIIGNGYSYNQAFFDNWDGSGSFEFRNADGSIATLLSDNPPLVYIAEDGTETIMQAHKYHTAGYDDQVALNPDDLDHTVGLLKTEDGQLRLGFEDLYNGGDKDFDDSVFTVDLGNVNAQVLSGYSYDPDTATLTPPDADDNPVFSENDELWGGNGSDVIYGRSGNDVLHGGNGRDTLWGGSGADELNGGNGVDELHGGKGNDVLYGDNGADELYGDSGDDILYGGSAKDFLNGGEGADVLYGGKSNDEVYGGKDDDFIYGGDGSDILYGNSGDDYISGGAQQDLLIGGSGNDELIGGGNNDDLQGGSGNDLISGGVGNDTLDGGSGIDTISFASSAARIVLNLKAGTAVGEGSDTVSNIENAIGTTYDDRLYGNHRDNQLTGGDGADRLYGSSGSDTLIGGSGNDYLDGGSGTDILLGGTGDDVLKGYKGADLLTGGEGDDLFVFRSLSEVGDVITDFTIGQDQLDILQLLQDINAPVGSSAFDDYVRVVDVGGNATVQIDSDGGGDSFSDDLVTLEGILASDISTDDFGIG